MTAETEALATCPCGKIPPRLTVQGDGECPEYAYVSGYCCGYWSIEFRNKGEPIPSDGSRALATAAWNQAPRAVSDKALAECKELLR